MSEGLKVLLVEDDPMVVRMYQKKLTMDGYNVSLAFNGEEGLAAIAKDRPDIILLDIMMPKMNGFEVLNVLKNDESLKNIPVIVLTNMDDRSEHMEKIRQLGANDYLVKANTSLKDLSAIIEKNATKS
jgi:two-component system alkaline phosphatase synthesis response regulator PhoP